MILEKYINMLDQSSKDIIKNGYIIFDIEDQALLENLKIEFLQYLKKKQYFC